MKRRDRVPCLVMVPAGRRARLFSVTDDGREADHSKNHKLYTRDKRRLTIADGQGTARGNVNRSSRRVRGVCEADFLLLLQVPTLNTGRPVYESLTWKLSFYGECEDLQDRHLHQNLRLLQQQLKNLHCLLIQLASLKDPASGEKCS